MNKLKIFTKLFRQTKQVAPTTVKARNLFFIQNPPDRGTFKKVQKEARFAQQRMAGISTVRTPYPGKSKNDGKSLQEVLKRFAPQNPQNSKQPAPQVNRFQQSSMEL